ncbi:hypothetical protein NCLIV_059890 [Neospora caninum Liverpool]|uniref:Uncharacterized protein n=1 Tax=Neospora caninum (strain Liverpool) TaxID=572307 RepID=F0VPB8_NEOCL|nr:hypothetical protein NCLIV_059890 [Neospora caninum Liverpool]CBZ55564.1 hypothetical protein NCLIV_059890 [Neospora caninum Liverpool]|eukprot:XP_003885592.1 hypothetical protein NCLIV_059890 [Neospora caninum Liverpool]
MIRHSNAVNVSELFPGTTEPILQPDVDDNNRKLKAEVQKEMHDVVKTFHTILKDEIKGLQTQLKNIEALPPTRTQQVLLDECLQKPDKTEQLTVGDGVDLQDNNGSSTSGRGDPVPPASYTVEEQPSHPYGSVLNPQPPQPMMEIRPYQAEAGTATCAHGPTVQQNESAVNPDHSNVIRIEPANERRSSHLVHNRASSAGGKDAIGVPLGCAFDTGLGHDPIQERYRSKSLGEPNYVQPGSVGDSFGGEPSVQDHYVPEPRHALSPYDARGTLAGKSSWPAPSSWVSSNAFLPSGEDIRRTEHAALTESAMPTHVDAHTGNRPVTVRPWESKVESSQSAGSHNAFTNAPDPMTLYGDGSRPNAPQQIRGTDSGPWQYMVQED